MHTLVAEIGKQLEFVFKTQLNRQNKIRLYLEWCVSKDSPCKAVSKYLQFSLSPPPATLRRRPEKRHFL